MKKILLFLSTLLAVSCLNAELVSGLSEKYNDNDNVAIKKNGWVESAWNKSKTKAKAELHEGESERKPELHEAESEMNETD